MGSSSSAAPSSPSAGQKMDIVVSEGHHVEVREDNLERLYQWPPPTEEEGALDQALNDAQRKTYRCCGCCCKRRTVASLGDWKMREKPSVVAQKEWDTDEPAFHNRVSCNCLIKVTTVDPKGSNYELRMKCKWAFRTADGGDQMETKMRVPGIRLPGLIVEVNESRVWKDLQKTKEDSNTVFWRGVSLFTVKGFERFEMQDFPYDRQFLYMELFHFVWVNNKDATDFDFSMYIASLRVECVSMLPEWQAFSPIIQALDETEPPSYSLPSTTTIEVLRPPKYSSRFAIHLRLQRANWFYVQQVFGLTILITLASITPLMLPPEITYIGNRLGLYSGGILTLTATKYAISDQLPSVPYTTMFDRIMQLEFFCVFACACEAVIIYRYVEKMPLDMQGQLLHAEKLRGTFSVRWWETFTFASLGIFWLLTWAWLGAEHLGLPERIGYRYKSWFEVLKGQEEQAGNDEIEKNHLKKEEQEAQAKLQQVNNEISKQLLRQGSHLDQLYERRKRAEEQLKKLAKEERRDKED